MPPLPETFWTAIDKGVCDIDTNGKLRKLNISEKRQLLSILREHEDCPVKWKNKERQKQKNILECLRQKIERLLNPEEFKKKKKANDARNHKKRTASGEAQAYAKKYKESGQKKAADEKYKESGKRKAANDRNYEKYKESGKRKAANDRNNAKNNPINSAKRSKATREANAQAILENKDHHEPTWPEDTLEKKANDTVEMIDEKCGPDGFVHVFVGAWPNQDLNEAMEAECFGKGRNSHAVFIDGTNSRHKFVRYSDVSTHVELFAPYTGTNCLNADGLEKRVQKKLMGWPQHRRMFVHAGKGSCKGKREAKTPFPYYTGVLVCDKSMEQIGIRLATTKDHAPKRKRSSSSL